MKSLFTLGLSENHRQKDEFERHEDIKREWEKLVAGHPVNKEKVRKIIANSWKRSMAYGVDPFYVKSKSLADESIIFRLNRANELINASWPFVQELGNLVAGSGFKIDLIDDEGYSLKVIGDQETIEKGNKVGVLIGTNRLEEKVGTNAAGLALAINQPVQVNGPEHFNQNLWEWTCSACPIHDPSGKIIGVVNMAGNKHLSHTHTLGMVISVANAIEKMLTLRRLNQKNESQFTNYLDKMIDTISDGIFFFNSTGKLIGANQKARQIFNLGPFNEKKHYKQLEDSLLAHSTIYKHINNNLECSDQEINLSKRNYFLTVKHFSTEEKREGSIAIIKDKIKKQPLTNQAFYTFEDIIGDDLRIREALQMAQKIASTNAPVLLYGESGTGKEMFAQAIHNASNRANQPFVPLNCSAVPTELIESELFGYEPGAFTGAAKNGKPGLMEIASGGTLFFDEIESMPLNMQTKILRALSENRITRVGGTERKPIDVRIISASKKDLLQEVGEGKFREDLYYRINLVTITLPPLRERTDLELLIKHFITKQSNHYGNMNLTISKDYIEALKNCAWRGNVRELENIIQRSFLLQENNQISLKQLPPEIAHNYLKSTLIKKNGEITKGTLLQDMEKELITFALEKTNGNLKRSAQYLGISRSTLYEKLQRYGISASSYRTAN